MRLLKYPAIALMLMILFSECSGKKDNDVAVYKLLDEGLISSRAAILNQTILMFQQLQAKMDDVKTHDMAEKWKPIADRCKELSEDVSEYIKALKKDLTEKALIKNNNGNDSLQEDNPEIVKIFFAKDGNGDSLYNKLLQYHNYVLALSPEIKLDFHNKIQLNVFDKDGEKFSDFNKIFFNNIPVAAAVSVLDKFELDVVNTENEIAQYCNNKVNIGCGFHLDFYRPLVHQSFSNVKPGQEIEITAGIGVFTDVAKPDISINNKKISIGDEGVAVSRFKASSNPGKYLNHIEISYYNQQGERETFNKDIEYTVIKDSCLTN